MIGHPPTLLDELISLTAGLFLLCSFGLIAASQILGCLRIYVVQSTLLTVSTLLLAAKYSSTDLLAVAGIYVATKIILIPWLLRRTARRSMIIRRELTLVIGVPTSLLVGLALAVLAYYITAPLTAHQLAVIRMEMPIGFAAVLIAIYTITIRREALPQMLGLLAIENGAFFAGIVVAPTFPLIGEVAAAFDVFMVVLTLGVLSRRMEHTSGHTAAGALAELREE